MYPERPSVLNTEIAVDEIDGGQKRSISNNTNYEQEEQQGRHVDIHYVYEDHAKRSACDPNGILRP